MELHIEGQHVEVSEAMRSVMVERLERLNAHHHDIIHARVALVKSNHHQHGSDEARVVLAMTRRKVLQVVKVGKTVEDAIDNALDALHRELADYRGRRRELDKPRLKAAKMGPGVAGTIVHLVPAQGYGLIDIGDEEEVHFMRQAVVGTPFERLTAGQQVEVDVVAHPEGCEVTRVMPR